MKASCKGKATVLDVALPHSFSPKQQPRRDIRTFFAERMTMPDAWERGVWGRVYHMVSGYGYNTVLACLVEPVVMAAFGRNEPYAQGRKLDTDDVLEFGRKAASMNFHPILSSDFWFGSPLMVSRNRGIKDVLSQIKTESIV